MSQKSPTPALSFEAIELVDRPWFPYLCTEMDRWRWENRGFEAFNLWIVLGGEGHLRCEGITYPLQAGATFIFAPGQTISAKHVHGQCITRFSAHFFPLLEGGRLQRVAGLPVMGGRCADLADLKEEVEGIMRMACQSDDEGVLTEQVYKLISRATGEGCVAQSEGSLNPRIAEAIRIIHETPWEVTSIPALARKIGWSRPHFDREFCQQVGQPPKRYLLHCKMRRARALLSSQRLSISEIADSLKYQDVYFFSRQFKQYFGLAPTVFRERTDSF